MLNIFFLFFLIMVLHNKYRYYCETEGKVVYEIVNVNSAVPTVCKNNAAHTISNVTLMQNGRNADVIHYPKTINTMTASVSSLTNSNFTRVLTYIYDASAYNNITQIKIASYMDSSVTDYDVRVVDITNNTLIASATFSNTDIAINDMGVLSNIPTNSSKIEVQVKKRGGGVNGTVYVESIAYHLE